MTDHIGDGNKKVTCPDCGERYELSDIPAWREINLFGVTWIIGRWREEDCGCPACQSDSERHERDRIYDAGVEYGYQKGYADDERN